MGNDIENDMMRQMDMGNDSMIDLGELNESQREAVLCCDAPSLVVAGAGSGKTRVLTYKIAYLLQGGMQPWNILALTFTNKAAAEMRRRVGGMVGEETASGLWMGTFHSVFSRILRQECALVGFGRDFTIYDAADSRSLLRSIIREMQLDEKTYKPGSVAARIGMAKNRLVTPEAYVADGRNRDADTQARMPAIGQIYVRYQSRCRQAGVMDFDDLLLYTWLLLSRHPDVAQRWEERFRFVLVDEYQDTNHAQHMIVWLLTQHRQRLCAVGDDAQSIYSFRGADIDNILRFGERYAGSRLFKLERNYRSTQTIVAAANSLISHNSGQIRKEAYSLAGQGGPVTVMQTYSDVDEANAVMRCVGELRRNERIPYAQMAVLYRTNAQSRPLEEAMRKASVPYRVYGGTSFYQRKEVKDVIAYLRLALNPHDEEALRRIVNYPARGIGQTTMDRVMAAASLHGLAPWDVLSAPHLLEGVGAAAKNRLHAFVRMMDTFHAMRLDRDAHSLALDIVRESGLQAETNRGHEPEDLARQENMQELMDGMAAFVQERREQGLGAGLADYLQEVSLLGDVEEGGSGTDDRLTLMTVHSAKGLEFRVVFIVGMEDGLFPSQMSMDSRRGLEEERRLFYVAMTRAGEHLIVTNARSRFRYGKTEFCQPSRFLREIDPRYLRFRGSAGSSTATAGTTTSTSAATSSAASRHFPTSPAGRPLTPPAGRPQPAAAPTRGAEPSHAAASPRRLVRLSPAMPAPPPSAPAANVTVGTRISHERFGLGTVTALEGKGIDAKATVTFENVGTKQLLLRFARFTVL